ncbi:MAG: hypothetical protein WA101_01470 [Minisyncoccia bacterium]
MEGLNISQDNTKKNQFEERVGEYAKQIVNVSDIKEARKLVIDIINFTKEDSSSSEKREVSWEDLDKYFEEPEKYSVLKVSGDEDVTEKIEEFISKYKNIFKEGNNLFVVENGNNPCIALVDNFIDEIELTKVYYNNGEKLELTPILGGEHNFILPEQIKK